MVDVETRLKLGKRTEKIKPKCSKTDELNYSLELRLRGAEKDSQVGMWNQRLYCSDIISNL